MRLIDFVVVEFWLWFGQVILVDFVVEQFGKCCWDVDEFVFVMWFCFQGYYCCGWIGVKLVGYNCFG